MSPSEVRPKIGDQVLVSSYSGSRHGQPADGWPGTVVRVGRSLVDIEFRGGRTTFRLDTRHSNDGYGHLRWWTLEERSESRRIDFALTELRLLGLERRTGFLADITADQAERLASAARDILGGAP